MTKTNDRLEKYLETETAGQTRVRGHMVSLWWQQLLAWPGTALLSSKLRHWCMDTAIVKPESQVPKSKVPKSRPIVFVLVKFL